MLLVNLFSNFGAAVRALFLSPGSIFSLTSLFCALTVAALFVAARRLARQRRVSLAFLLRALFPRRLLTSASTRADLFCLAANSFVYGSILAGAVLSSAVLAGSVANGLTALFGRAGSPPLPEFVLRAMATIVLFLAYELGYWIDHCLSHRLPSCGNSTRCTTAPKC
jgi:sterol desaturase/sphingolipid hydroxylase (fatty acid hydroxylase superfamily)